MTLTEFVNTYNGTKVGDGQCVALIKQYEQDVLNLTPVAVGNAYQYYDNYENQEFLYNNFNRIAYDGTNIPEVGDIIVWNTNVGNGNGHVAIVFSDITNENFNSFDQNWNTPLLCNLETHNYINVLGWLRKKEITPDIKSVKLKNKFKWVLYANKIRKRNK